MTYVIVGGCIFDALSAAPRRPMSREREVEREGW